MPKICLCSCITLCLMLCVITLWLIFWATLNATSTSGYEQTSRNFPQCVLSWNSSRATWLGMFGWLWQNCPAFHHKWCRHEFSENSQWKVQLMRETHQVIASFLPSLPFEINWVFLTMLKLLRMLNFLITTYQCR